jgi:hypothetical protein
MPKEDADIYIVRKTITISSRHDKFIKDNSISLSKFVQKKIDELIAERR